MGVWAGGVRKHLCHRLGCPVTRLNVLWRIGLHLLTEEHQNVVVIFALSQGHSSFLDWGNKKREDVVRAWDS